MQKQRPNEQLQKFTFFNIEEIQDVQDDPNSHKLIDLDTSQAIYIDPKLYFGSVKEPFVFIFDLKKIQGSFKPYNKKLELIDKSSFEGKNYLVTFGIDEEGSADVSYIRIWDINVNFPEQQPVMKKQIMIGKPGSPCKNYNSFSISQDMQAMAFGLQTGQIILTKSKKGLINDDTTQIIQLDQRPIRLVVFSKKIEAGQGLNLFYCTEDKIFCYVDLSKKRDIYGQAGGSLFDTNPRGNLIGCPHEDNKMIYEFSSDSQVADWEYQGEKLELKCFGNNYLLLLLRNQTNQEQQFVIFDTLNLYIAFMQQYQKEKFIQKIIPTPNCIYLITLEKQDRKILRLTEKEDPLKIESFFKASSYDAAYRFASNQNCDPMLLAEICRLHASRLYEKSEYDQSIKKYIETIGYVEPSYIIRQFLDVSHIEQLILYLEAIHKKGKNDRHHTALLLNCYVKQQAIDKLKEFIEKQANYSDLFDIETAIKVCRELNHFDLALSLAKQRQRHEQYLDIMIENKGLYEEAINFIIQTIPIQDKTKYVLQFGQLLMKQKPTMMLELIQNLVKVQSIVNLWRQPSEGQKNDMQLKQEERDLLTKLGVQENQYEALKQITFRNPEEFLHLFVSNNEYLKLYLEYLTANIPNLPNEKTIFHRLFEFYLEQYHEQDAQQSNKPEQQFRMLKDSQVSIITSRINKLLNEEKYQKKYDKNHLLVLFKMYNYRPGIVILCEQMNLREELLNFYITANNAKSIIQTCKDYGEQETNLWVQALKYFCKPSDTYDQRNLEHIKDILQHIQGMQNLSPLLILNILSKNKNIPFGAVKSYFITKLLKDKQLIDQEKDDINTKMQLAQKQRQEYKKLKTQAKTFQTQNCSYCKQILTSPSWHFMCGCSYHEMCLRTDQDTQQKECQICSQELKSNVNKKLDYEAKVNNTKEFFEKMDSIPNKFDVISEFLGKGLFQRKPEQQNSDQMQV